MEHLTAATRAGALAIAQTKSVIAMLKKKHPDLDIEIKTITTAGDSDRRTALWNLKDTGFFTSQLEDALLAHQADFAVHSFKDLPTQMRQGLKIAAVCDRKFVEDCLLSNLKVASIEQLPKGAKIGTSSLRRATQIKHSRADLQIIPVRGNVKTRIRKLDADDYDAIVLARAGMERLGLGKRISFVFEPSEFIPAPAQGALAIQTRSDDKKTNEFIETINDKDSETETAAERKILTVLHCGCHAPVGAYAKISDSKIKIHVFISHSDGTNYIAAAKEGKAQEAETIAENLALELLSSGGKEILKNMK
ncbi:MAG: hydroxymethylbilane synthase [Sedimentisphaerales bacterium]|nr:hydroxymethylbilane synthase [Sedimentisphaerales bacterium]